MKAPKSDLELSVPCELTPSCLHQQQHNVQLINTNAVILKACFMKRYCWFHPEYEKGESERIISGQKKNFTKYNYVILSTDELHKVKANDHLTIIGHSTPPKTHPESEEDTGLYIQGDNADQCVTRLKGHGLLYAPKILSLECCQAAKSNGIAAQLSAHPLFKYSLVEASTGAVGRDPGFFSGPVNDQYGRVLLGKQQWVFYISGYAVAIQNHNSYYLEGILAQISPQQFHTTFFSHYQPGCFKGRVGRYCASNKTQIDLEQALFFAMEKKGAATNDALDETIKELYQPRQAL